MKGYEKVGPRQRNKLLCRCVRCGMFRGFQTPGCFSLHLKDDLASVDELMPQSCYLSIKHRKESLEVMRSSFKSSEG